ncbi:DUF4156 domain-containing protein [Lysobacter sp. TY2-98]|uniref:DUF4156 domain-containing protein n=1 Tax=Lysobacter sp. TY2-98 TaxID=2290922 RepID=UPI000E1FF935|nr:DUF4156 domain-containing protein [Lysobacter sp. TY2-98]AXK73341.1 DUF4156 domain-containing protein [Lysobacter sp. TY2-98]
MRHAVRLASLTTLVLAASACTWVPMQQGAAAVQVRALNAATPGCTKLGEIEGNVTDRVALYERNPLRVQEELETMARNEAVGLSANTVVPLEAPHDGRQRYSAWRCPR